MLINELSRDQCREVLARLELGRLACSRLDRPDVVPDHFLQRRGAELRLCLLDDRAEGPVDAGNPEVCLEVEEIEDKSSWTTVVVFGRYEEIHQRPEEAEARGRAEQLFAARGEWWLASGRQTARTRAPRGRGLSDSD